MADEKQDENSRAIVRMAEEFCEEQGIFSGGGVVVACSGGVDSLTLADVFYKIGKRRGLTFVVAHFEHGIRGEVSREDERFVERWTKERGIPFFSESADVPSFAKERRMSIETAARLLRYDFLRRTAKENGCAFIATAHHADDCAETVLMHLLRGAGIDGLAGIKRRNDDIIRPLLGATKEQLIRYADCNNLAPRVDATNFSADTTRNKVRLLLLPQLKKEFNGNIVDTLVRLAEIAQDQCDFLQRETDRVWRFVIDETEGEMRILRKKFAKLPRALQREVLRRFFSAQGALTDMEFTHLEAVRRLVIEGHSGNVLDLPHRRRVEVARNSMYLR